MNYELILNFLVFWGIWILIPVLLDGTISARHIIFSWKMLLKNKKSGPDTRKLDFLPQVSIVIPVHNSAATLYNCLKSIAGQTYPTTRLEVFLIDNGSTDGSFGVFNEFSNNHPNLLLRWVKLQEAGKAKALNSGIFLGNSEILINVDSDTWLEPEVLMETVKTFFLDGSVAGATAAIMVDTDQISKNSWVLKFVQTCEAFEYLEAFFIGRKYQAYHNELFTLAGAFSCFNRKSLLQTFLYDQNSLSEDTKLTFELRRKNREKRVTFIEKAKVYVEPIPSLSKLYAQRVRWQRGELDVIGSYGEYYRGGLVKMARSFTSRLLFVDHTMIFPRIVWTVLVPFLIFLGYPLELIVFANLFVYVVYLFIDLNYLAITYFYLDSKYREFLKKGFGLIFLMPLYRFIVFWFRAAGAIHSVTEPAKWTVKSPIELTKEALKRNL